MLLLQRSGLIYLVPEVLQVRVAFVDLDDVPVRVFDGEVSSERFIQNVGGSVPGNRQAVRRDFQIFIGGELKYDGGRVLMGGRVPGDLAMNRQGF